MLCRLSSTIRLTIDLFIRLQFMKASTTNPRATEKHKYMKHSTLAIRTLLHAAWGAAGGILFYQVALPKLIPALVPILRSWLGTNGYAIVDLVAGFSSVGTERAPGGPDATSWSPEAAAAQASADTSSRSSETTHMSEFYLSYIDGDTCSFLFMIFATQLTALTVLASARISSGIGMIQPLYHFAVTVLQPFLALLCISLACNGMIGGVQQGADPMACIATLFLTILYYVGGGLCLLRFLDPFP